MKLGGKVISIIFVLLILCVLASFVYKFFGVDVTYENFTFCAPDDCACVCERNEYKAYCNSPYLKDGPEGLCNCRWDAGSRMCVGQRARNVKCQM